MSAERRQEMMDNLEVRVWSYKRTGLGTLDREYDFNEIATITRASAAKIYGYQDRGELTPGYNADIAVYDLNPNTIDPSKEPAAIEKAFGNAMYTIKDGQILVKDGEVVKVVPSHTLWTNVQGFEEQEKAVMEEVMPRFRRYYTVKFENYQVQDHFTPYPTYTTVQASK
jgi:formylmethanofuran dehydrogenase subunit A